MKTETALKFSECLNCTKLGKKCAGPNLAVLEIREIVVWLVALKKKLGWTNEKLAEVSEVPLGTINRILSGNYENCQLLTLRKMMRPMLGYVENGEPVVCPFLYETSDYAEELKKQIEHKDAKIEKLRAENADYRNEVKEYKEELREYKAELKKYQQVSARRTAMLIGAMLLIIVILLADILLPQIGWFRF